MVGALLLSIAAVQANDNACCKRACLKCEKKTCRCERSCKPCCEKKVCPKCEHKPCVCERIRKPRCEKKECPKKQCPCHEHTCRCEHHEEVENMGE